MIAQRPAQKLTLEEKQKFEIHKEVFVTIRLIDMVEKCAQLADEKMTPELHRQEISRLLLKYNNLTAQIPNFDFQKFFEEFDLEDCKFAKSRIRQGEPKQKNQNNLQLVKEIMQNFYRMTDIIQMHEENLTVGKLKTLMGTQIACLTRAERELPPYNSYLKEMQGIYQRCFERDLMLGFSAEELNELSTTIEIAFTSFMNNNN